MKNFKLIKFRLVFLSIFLLLSAVSCNLPDESNASEEPAVLSPGDTCAWIDKPLNESHHPLAPIDILFHGGDGIGISAFELSIDGVVILDQVSDNPAETLQTYTFPWIPTSPGEYSLSLRVLNAENNWSAPASTHIYVDGEPTQSLSFTILPTATTAPISVSTPIVTGAIFTNLSKSTELFYFRFSDCADRTPNLVKFSIDVVDNAGVATVGLFFKLQNKNDGSMTVWDSMAMYKIPSSDTFYATIDADMLPQLGAGNESWLMYQFISTDTNEVLSRSEIFDDITVKGCGP